MVAENAYFATRSQMDNRDNRGLFQAGFSIAWEAAGAGKMCDGNWIPTTPFVQP